LPGNRRSRDRPVMPGPGRRPGFGGGPGHGRTYGPKAKIKDVEGTLRRLWSYLRRRRTLLAAVLMMTVLAAAANMMGPLLIGRAIDRYILPGDLPGLLRMAGLMLTVYATGALATLLQNYLMVDAAQNTVQELRNDVFAKLQTLPLRFFDSRTHGEIMSRVTNDIDNINTTLNSSVTNLFSSFITVSGTLVVMTVLSPLLTLLSMLIIPLLFLTTGKIAKRTGEYFREQQQQLGRLNGLIEETIAGQRVVKVFTQEEKAINKFADANTRLREVGLRAQVFAGMIMPLMGVLNNLSFAAIAAAGSWMAVNKMITVGIIASFINYSRQFTRPLNEIAINTI
jgi:ATP-binding cassette subfamily B multidrug efflux pump